MPQNHTVTAACATTTASAAGGDIEKLLGEVIPTIAAQVAAQYNYNVNQLTLEAINTAITLAWEEFIATTISNTSGIFGTFGTSDNATLDMTAAPPAGALDLSNTKDQVYIIADACRVIGIKFGVHQNEGYFQFETAFSPSPRYDHGGADDIPLGFFKNFDLYYARQTPAAQSLLARYGDEPGEYYAHNPDLPGAPTAHATENTEADAALYEAFERAQRANLFAGTDLAGNDGLGSIMIPELAVIEYRQSSAPGLNS